MGKILDAESALPISADSANSHNGDRPATWDLYIVAALPLTCTWKGLLVCPTGSVCPKAAAKVHSSRVGDLKSSEVNDDPGAKLRPTAMSSLYLGLYPHPTDGISCDLAKRAGLAGLVRASFWVSPGSWSFESPFPIEIYQAPALPLLCLSCHVLSQDTDFCRARQRECSC